MVDHRSPLQRFYDRVDDRVEAAIGRGLDGLKWQEPVLIAGLLLLAPLVMLFMVFRCLAGGELLEDVPGWRRVPIVLLLPLLVPIVYFPLLFSGLVLPMVRRFWRRRRALRHADRAVRDLLREVAVPERSAGMGTS